MAMLISKPMASLVPDYYGPQDFLLPFCSLLLWHTAPETVTQQAFTSNVTTAVCKM